MSRLLGAVRITGVSEKTSVFFRLKQTSVMNLSHRRGRYYKEEPTITSAENISMLTAVISAPALHHSQLHATQNSAVCHLANGFCNKAFVLRISQFVFLATYYQYSFSQIPGVRSLWRLNWHIPFLGSRCETCFTSRDADPLYQGGMDGDWNTQHLTDRGYIHSTVQTRYLTRRDYLGYFVGVKMDPNASQCFGA